MKKIFVFVLVTLFFSQISIAQTDEKDSKFSYGFLFERNEGRLDLINKSDIWPVVGIDVENMRGLSLGINFGIPLNKIMTFSPQATLSFHKSIFTYKYYLSGLVKEPTFPMESVTLEVPLHLVFSIPVVKNISPTISIGGRYLYDLAGNDRVVNSLDIERHISIKNHDFSIDFGAGVEFGFLPFNVRPELMYSFGLINLQADMENPGLSDSIESIHRKRIAVRLLIYKK